MSASACAPCFLVHGERTESVGDTGGGEPREEFAERTVVSPKPGEVLRPACDWTDDQADLATQAAHLDDMAFRPATQRCYTHVTLCQQGRSAWRL
jgi:hypothetical protein